MQEIRQAMRGHGEILMGKNTMIRKAIRGHIHANPSLEKLLSFVVGNVGFVFTNEDLNDVRQKLLENKRVSSYFSFFTLKKLNYFEYYFQILFLKNEL